MNLLDTQKIYTYIHSVMCKCTTFRWGLLRLAPIILCSDWVRCKKNLNNLTAWAVLRLFWITCVYICMYPLDFLTIGCIRCYWQRIFIEDYKDWELVTRLGRQQSTKVHSLWEGYLLFLNNFKKHQWNLLYNLSYDSFGWGHSFCKGLVSFGCIGGEIYGLCIIPYLPYGIF